MADDENDPTAPFNELEAFDSFWSALAWRQVRKRLPIAAKKTLRNRYFFANFVYLCYAIGILLVDYSTLFNGEEEIELTTTTPMISTPLYYCNETIPVFYCDESLPAYICNGTATTTEIVPSTTTEEIVEAPGYTAYNIMFIVLGFVHLVSATLYWWAWKDHKWNDVVMIPEYLNHIEAALYLWSAFWYTKEDGYYGYYTSRLHIIETTAAFVELFASFGWIMSWYRTYTRTIGRGYTLDDPDTVAYTLTTLSSFVYITYNIEILLHPDEYGTNTRYYTGDVMYFVGAVFYLVANLRDDGWLWWLPVAGQYGIAAGKIQTGRPVLTGLPHYPIAGVDPCARRCRRRRSVVHDDLPVKVLSNGK